MKRPASPVGPAAGATSPPAKSTSPASSSSPSRRPQTAAPARPARPSAPGAAPPPAGRRDDTAAIASPAATDAAAGLPLGYRPPSSKRRQPFVKTLQFRQTVIPVLLTTGVMMLLIAIAGWTADPEAPLARLPQWTTALLIATGVLLLGLAVANMLFVRSELVRSSSPPPR